MSTNGFIGRLRLDSQFMTSHTEQQIITIKILHNISRSKDNQAMKFGQLIKKVVSRNQAENEVAKLVSGLFLFLKKSLCKVKASGQHLSFNIFS